MTSKSNYDIACYKVNIASKPILYRIMQIYPINSDENYIFIQFLEFPQFSNFECTQLMNTRNTTNTQN